MRRFRAVISFPLMIMLLSVCLVVLGGNTNLGMHDFGRLNVSFLQTQQASDCVIFQQGTDAVLIDAGTAADAPGIIEALETRGVERILCFILTYAGEEHMGGAAAVLNHFPTERVIIPRDNGESTLVAEVREAAEKNRSRVTVQSLSRLYRFGDANFTIYPPLEKHYQNEGNYSLGVLVQHGNVRMFFAGDAKEKRTEELLRFRLPKVTMYKVANHGRLNDFSQELIHVLQPRWAVVAAPEADTAITQAVAAEGGEMLYTTNGELNFTSDRETLYRTAVPE